jgi:hypothetical protein
MAFYFPDATVQSLLDLVAKTSQFGSECHPKHVGGGFGLEEAEQAHGMILEGDT